MTRSSVSNLNQSSLYIPSALPEIVWKHHEKSLFYPMNEWRNHNRLPPVILITGQPGIGKRSVAYFLAQWILCTFKKPFPTPSSQSLANPLIPCGECVSCKQILSGHSVDLTEIVSDSQENPHQKLNSHSNPSSLASTGTLKIDQFRKLKISAGFSPAEGNHQIIIIPNAERMTLQAANSVLKLLEEPPQGWIFFLTTQDPSLLLPTLTSRCQTFRLRPFSSQLLQHLLQLAQVDSERIKTCSDLAQGSWRQALDLASDPIWSQRKTILKFFQEPTSVFQALLDWVAQEPSHFDTLLDFIEQGTSELIRWSAQASQISPDAEELLDHAKQVIKKLGSLRAAQLFWLERAESISIARQESQTPVNRKLLVQNVLLPWVGALA